MATPDREQLILETLFNIKDDVAEIKRELGQHRAILVGADGNNGINSRVRNLEEGATKLSDSLNQYLISGRRDTCYGTDAVDALRAEIKQSIVTKTESRRTLAASLTAIAVALISAGSVIINKKG